jgi:hypothetical protein
MDYRTPGSHSWRLSFASGAWLWRRLGFEGGAYIAENADKPPHLYNAPHLHLGSPGHNRSGFIAQRGYAVEATLLREKRICNGIESANRCVVRKVAITFRHPSRLGFKVANPDYELRDLLAASRHGSPFHPYSRKKMRSRDSRIARNDAIGPSAASTIACCSGVNGGTHAITEPDTILCLF